MRASLAVPSRPVTSSIIRDSFVAVSGETTRTGVVAGVGTSVPLSLTVPSTSDGGTRTPLFAMVAKMLAACTAVTAYP